MPEVSGTETGCLKAGLRPRWNTSLLAAGVLEAALWYWITYFFFTWLVPSVPQLTSFVGWRARPSGPAGPSWSEGRRCMRWNAGACMKCGCMQWNAGACSILGMFGVVLLSEDGLDTWGGASQCLAQGSHMPAKDTALGPHLLWCADWK